MASALESILAAAESAVGVEYKWGGNNLASGVDCSGLVQQAFRAAGVQLPRVSAQQAKAGLAVEWNDMQPGDLIWMDYNGRNQGADHIAIYVGNGLMIESPKPGKKVQVVKIPSDQARRVPMGVTRVLGVAPQSQAPLPVTLGPNQDRTYTTQALSGAAGPVQAPASVIVSSAPGGGLGDDLPPNASPEQVEAYLRQKYPQVAPLLANEEIKNFVFSSVQDGSIRNPGEFTRRFQNTNYFKTTTPESRALDALIGTDRTAAGQSIERAKALLSDRFATLGITADDEDLGAAAKKAIREGWISLDGEVSDENALGDFSAFLLGAQTGEGEFAPGAASVSVEGLGKLARDYGVTMPQSALQNWTMKIMQGQANAETYKQYVTSLAKAQWGGDQDVVRAIDNGLTLDDYFAPHRAAIGKYFELGDNEVDLFNDPRFSEVTQIYDEKTKTRRAMTLGETQRWAMQHAPKNTSWYQQADAELDNNLARFLGLVA